MDNGRTLLENRITELEKQVREAEEKVSSLSIAVRAEREIAKIAADMVNIGLWEYDIAAGIIYQIKKMGGIYEADLDPIKNFREAMLTWEAVYSEDISEFHLFCDALERGDPEIAYDVRGINDFNEIVWYRYEGKTIFGDDGKPLKVVGRTTDVTGEKGAVSENTKAAASEGDSYSRFVSEVEEKLKEKTEKHSALVLYGIDRFDELSSREDYDITDITEALEKMLTAHCAVEQGSICVQAEAGVFAVYMRFSDIPRINTTIARQVYRFHDMQFSDGVSSEVISISAGVAVFRNSKSYSAVYKEAFTAMKKAMQKGGNGFLHFNAGMENETSADDSGTDIKEKIKGLPDSDKIYKCINIAVTDESARFTALKQAFELTGVYTGCSTAVFRWLGDEKDTVIWQSDSVGTVPRIVPNCGKDQLADIFKNEDFVIIASDKVSDGRYGFDFEDGACCAAYCPVAENGIPAGYFAFVSDVRMSWQHLDVSLLEALKAAVDHLVSERAARINEKRRSDFMAAVTNDLSIEGFTLMPDTFEVDYVSESTVRNCGMQKGDICYKRIRGIDTPCGDCPVHKLAGGQLSASTAHYRESDNRWIEVTASQFEAEDGSLRYAVSRADVTSCISNIQTRDALTGTLSFDSFSVDAMRLFAEKARDISVAIINVANFRQLNETNGYETGNAVIIAAADVLNSMTEKGELLCRVDGARFAVVFREKDTEKVCGRIRQISDAVQAQVRERCSLKIYIISGVYTHGDENIGIMAALDRAILAQKTVKDKAYYTSNLVVVYDDKMNDEMLSKQYIESHMVEALENDEFKVFYQPKVCPVTGRVEGAEALVRWIRPDGEIISPGRFIPLFERNGFISDMDFAVYRSVINDIRRWQAMDIEIPTISLNVSRDHLNDDRFVENICVMAFRSGVSSSKIELEITESMLNDNMSRLIDTMTALKDAGFRISIDDFGSGYSSLNLIALLPCDTLKIDGGFFLRNQLTDKNKAVISSVIELAKKLKFTVVSEGVETDEQVDFLKNLECELIQGYYYYKPMPSAEFEKLLLEQYG